MNVFFEMGRYFTEDVALCWLLMVSHEVVSEHEILDSLTNYAVYGSGDTNEERHTCEKLKNMCHFATKIQ